MALVDEITEHKIIKIDQSCQITDPVYLMWLNEFGGSSYWLFKRIGTKEITTKNSGFYEKYLPDLNAQGNDGIVRKDVEIAIKLGAKIDKDDIDGISGLFKSLKVKMLTIDKWQEESIIEWSDVLIKDGTKIFYNQNFNFIDVEFDIKLPKQYNILG